MRQKIDCLAVRLCTAMIFMFITSAIFAQKTVTGTVTNAKDNQPIVGASVTVKGTNVGAATSSTGTFTLTVPSGKNILVISSVGFDEIEVDVSSQTSISVSLKEKTSSLDEIVVTGYTSQKKKDITGSVAVVSVKDLKSVPGGTTESLLQGQASGVSVINSGAPGGGSNIRIRGITSLGSADPLIIIDGVQGSLHDLNVNDIESIQVLKDAGAAAIYGIQGSNGVIIVTTKKGRGKAKVNYDAYIGTQRPLKDGFNIANTKEYGDALWMQAANDGVQASNAQYGDGTTPVIPDYITPAGAMEGDPGTDPSTYDINTHQITKANKTGTDWFHEVFKPAMIQNHSLQASGGSDKSSYLFSLNYLNQQGTLINTYIKRYAARINTLFNIKNNIRVGENAYVFYRQNPQISNQNEGNAISLTYREPAIIPVYDIKGNFAGTKSGGLGNSGNPVAAQMRQADNVGNDWQVNGNVFGEVDFLKHFTIRTSFGGTFDNYYYYYFNYTAYENAEGNTSANGFVEGAGYNSQWLWTNTLNYSNIFGKHTVKVLVGSEAKNQYNRGFSAGRSNYYTTSPDYWTLNTGDPSTQNNNGGSPTQISLFSLFGRVDYNFADKYLLSGVIRRDGASVFAADHRYGNFPSVTAGWRISKENFLKNVSWITDLKLRGGWGKLGSISNINPTNPYTLYGSSAGSSYYAINGQSNSSTQGFYSRQLGNANTTWEEDIVTNIGLDATILKNKLDFSVEVYKKAISGLLYPLQFQIGNFIGGPSAPYVNAGNIQNKGIDASITYHGSVGNDFKFDVSANITSYKSKVVSLPEGYKYVDQYSGGSTRIGAFVRTQPGQPIGAFYGLQEIGLFQTQEEVDKAPAQDGKEVGFFKFKDVNGDGKVDDNDRTFFGNPNPDFTYGLSISASYKNFDFSSFFYGSQGNDVINYVRYWIDFPQVFGDVSKDAVYNSWTPTNTDAKVPKLTQKANFSTSSKFSSYYMEDGSYFRCKQMQLGYTIPSTTLKRFGIDRLRIYIQAANLFTITKYTGLDPELQGSSLSDNSNFGIDFGNYPANQKNYNVGVNVTF